MIYQDFIEALKFAAQKELSYAPENIEFRPEGYTSDDPADINWIKDTNKRYMGRESEILLTDFLVLRKPDPSGIVNMHRVATRRLYEDAEKDGFDAAFDILRKSCNDIRAANVDMGRLSKRSSSNYEDIRDQLIIRPLNYSLHARDLDECVYRNVGDFVLVLYQLLGDANHSLVTSKIKTYDLKRWNMDGDMDKVMQDALENTMKIYPPRVYNHRLGKEVDFLTESFSRSDITFMNNILLSASNATNGAVALFYPGVIKKMMNIMGGPFLTVFMNINDVLIFEHNDPMAAFFAETAREEGGMGEMLSKQFYLCDENGLHTVIASMSNGGKAKGNTGSKKSHKHNKKKR